VANLRRNHARQGQGLQTTFRLVIFVFVAIGALVGGYIFLKKYGHQYFETEEFAESDHPARTFLPSASGQVIHHTYYTLSYNEKNEQAQWVAYVMDRKMLNVPNLPRYNYFDPDYQVTTRSAFHRDYNSSGYTRGHLVPAGDMAFDTLAMRETFLMSNISPQLRAFNNGIWKELEENVRDWTYKAESLYIISGPIFTGYRKTIGRENKIAVPDAFFKVLLDYTDPERKAIAFILPHEMSERRLQEFMVSVDEVERVTGIDFFNEMINDVEEEKLESQFDKTKWNVSDKRYQLRITKWNYE
jgi:endonuclease G